VAVMATGAALAAKPDLQPKLTAMVSEAMPMGVAGGGNALATRHDYTSMLPSISVPVLVVEGQDDTVYPLPIAQALAAAIPGSTLAVIPGAAHASMFQEPGKANAQISAWITNVIQ
jgi:pimeloyl-ACP methyl ester carboxylesterase